MRGIPQTSMANMHAIGIAYDASYCDACTISHLFLKLYDKTLSKSPHRAVNIVSAA